VDELFVIWVKVFGLLGFAKKQEIIRAISDIVGEFKEVDDKSLKGEGAVRIKVGCLDPSAINYSVIIYINDIGYKIKWEAEVDTEGTGSIDGGGTMMMMMLMIWMMITLQEERKVGVRMTKGVQRKRSLLKMQMAKGGLSARLNLPLQLLKETLKTCKTP
jgi:hypothetical protein